MIHMFIIPANDRIDDCIAIRKKVFVEEQGVPVELEVDEMDSPSAPCFHFLMLDDEKAGEPGPFGTFRAYYETADTVHLQRFCVLKEYRAQGLGRGGSSSFRSFSVCAAQRSSPSAHSAPPSPSTKNAAAAACRESSSTRACRTGRGKRS